MRFLSSTKTLFNKLSIRYKSNFRFVYYLTEKGNDLNITSNYKQVFNDDFTLDYSNNWVMNDRSYNITYDYWYDKSQIKKTSDGISLSSVERHRYFRDIDSIIKYSTVSINTKNKWKYGIFKITTKLPSGTFLNPKISLIDDSLIPTRIDILEGHTYKDTNYRNGLSLGSNLLYNIEGTHQKRNHKLPNDVTKDFIEYTIWWEKDFIKIYYNGYLVRKIVDKKILSILSNGEKQVLIEYGLHNRFNMNNITPFVIKNVSIYQKD